MPTLPYAPSVLAALCTVVAVSLLAVKLATRGEKPGAKLPGATAGRTWIPKGQRLRSGDRWIHADKPLGSYHELSGMVCPADGEYYKESGS